MLVIDYLQISPVEEIERLKCQFEEPALLDEEAARQAQIYTIKVSADSRIATG